MEVTGQWADSLAALERLFLLKLLAWGALSALVGTVLMLLARRPVDTRPMLGALATTLVLAGCAEIAVALLARQGVDLRDLGAATSLDRATWFTAGAAIGVAACSLGIGVASQAKFGARLGGYAAAVVTGACVGVVLHGAAVALLSVQLGASIVR